MSKNLIVDVDGVIAEFDFPNLLGQYMGVRLPTAKVNTFDLSNLLGVSKVAIKEMFEAEVFNHQQIVIGASYYLRSFMQKGFDILIFSDRLQWMTKEELGDWLEEQGVPFSEVIDRDSLPSFAVAHIDDRPAKLMEVWETIKVNKLLLFDRPWNRRCMNITGRLTRVKNWKQIWRELNG